MHSATFELATEELDQRFVEALKTLFNGKTIKITVTTDDPHSSGLAEIIAANKREKTVHQISPEALDFILEKMTAGEDFDLLGELEQHRVVRQ